VTKIIIDKEERRKNMSEFIAALNNVADAVGNLSARFDVFAVEANARQKAIEKLDHAVFGNSKAGIEQRVSRLEIYASIIVGLTSTGIIGLVAFIIIKIVELVFTHK
jgi:hypothetical protein